MKRGKLQKMISVRDLLRNMRTHSVLAVGTSVALATVLCGSIASNVLGTIEADATAIETNTLQLAEQMEEGAEILDLYVAELRERMNRVQEALDVMDGAIASGAEAVETIERSLNEIKSIDEWVKDAFVKVVNDMETVKGDIADDREQIGEIMRMIQDVTTLTYAEKSTLETMEEDVNRVTDTVTRHYTVLSADVSAIMEKLKTYDVKAKPFVDAVHKLDECFLYGMRGVQLAKAAFGESDSADDATALMLARLQLSMEGVQERPESTGNPDGAVESLRGQVQASNDTLSALREEIAETGERLNELTLALDGMSGDIRSMQAQVSGAVQAGEASRDEVARMRQEQQDAMEDAFAGQQKAWGEAAGKQQETLDAAAGKQQEALDAAAGKQQEALDAAAGKQQETLDAAAEKQKETLDAAAEKQQETLDAAAEKQQETLDAAAEKQQETLDAAAEKQQETLDAASEKQQETLDAAAEKQQETLDAATEKQQETLDAAAEKQQETLDAAAEKQQETLDAAAEKQQEALDAAAEKQQEALDAATEKQQETLDAATEKQQGALDDAAKKQQETLDGAAKKQQETLDAAAQKQQATLDAAAQKQQAALDAAALKQQSALDAATGKQQELLEKSGTFSARGEGYAVVTFEFDIGNDTGYTFDFSGHLSNCDAITNGDILVRRFFLKTTGSASGHVGVAAQIDLDTASYDPSTGCLVVTQKMLDTAYGGQKGYVTFAVIGGTLR